MASHLPTIEPTRTKTPSPARTPPRRDSTELVSTLPASSGSPKLASATKKSDEIERSSSAASPPEYPSEKEKGVIAAASEHGSHDDLHEEPVRKTGPKAAFKRGYSRFGRYVWHASFFLFFTGWWIALLVLQNGKMNILIPSLVWGAIMLRLIFYYVPSSYVSRPIKFVWMQSAVRLQDLVPEKFQTLAGAAVVLAVVLVGTFASEESADNTRENRAVSIFGLLVIGFCFWATSRHRRHINWRAVLGGVLSQYIIALFVLRTQVGYDIFKFIADRAIDLLGFAQKGTTFLTSADAVATFGWFVLNVVPAIIFFVAIVQLLYYIGFLAWFIGKIATFVFWALRVSGAEAVVAAATPFVGQGESAMLVRPFIPHMTKAELHQIMTCGFATISGSVLVAFISFGFSPQALVSSCVMSIPASITISKLRYPEMGEPLTAGKVTIPEEDEAEKPKNALHAFANGSWLGIKIAGMIIAGLLCVLAFVGLVDGLLGWWGRYLNIREPELSLTLIFGYLFYPVAWLIGVPRGPDVLKVARLIATKVIANEFSAFLTWQGDVETYGDMSPRSQLIATYALCGFGNISSLGIQIGIFGQLAPSRGGDVSALAFSALLSGVMSTLSSAAVAGLVIAGEQVASSA